MLTSVTGHWRADNLSVGLPVTQSISQSLQENGSHPSMPNIWLGRAYKLVTHIGLHLISWSIALRFAQCTRARLHCNYELLAIGQVCIWSWGSLGGL